MPKEREQKLAKNEAFKIMQSSSHTRYLRCLLNVHFIQNLIFSLSLFFRVFSLEPSKMTNGLLAMAYLSPASDDLGDDDGDDSDDWSSQMTSPYDDNLGPGPPPPEFLLPPPPLPDFMLQEMEGDCVQRSLPEHFANCDMSFVSIFEVIIVSVVVNIFTY